MLLMLVPQLLGIVWIREMQVDRREKIRVAQPDGRKVDCRGRRSRLPGRYTRARFALRLLAVAIPHFSKAGDQCAASEIALVLAMDGAPMPPQRILAKIVDCDNFRMRGSSCPMAVRKVGSWNSHDRNLPDQHGVVHGDYVR